MWLQYSPVFVSLNTLKKNPINNEVIKLSFTI